MTEFVISDTHFNHANILHFRDEFNHLIRGKMFRDIQEHDDYIVDQWNSVVNEKDTVFHLGDCHFGKAIAAQYLDKLYSRLNGRKYLILGNHDQAHDPLLQTHFKKIMGATVDKKNRFLFTHIPAHMMLSDEEMRHYDINVHGHIHHQDAPSAKHINVAVERIGYTPQRLSDLREKYGN